MRVTSTLILATGLAVPPAAARAQAPAQIIDEVDRLLRGESSHGFAEMKVVTENWERSLEMEVWSLGTEYSLVRVMGSWMGSHFTNDDLVKESRLIEDYEIEIAFEGEREGEQVWELRLVPKPEAPVVWGRIDYRVRKRDKMPLWARYYDEDGNLSRTLEFSDFRRMGGRLVPASMHMVPADSPRESTSFVYDGLEFDVDLDRSFFSLQALKRRR